MAHGIQMKNSATKKPLPVTKPSPPPRYVGDIDDELEKYFIACNDRIDHLRKSATEMVSAEEANASPRRLYSLRRRSPTLEDIPGSRKHLHRQKSAEALNKLQIISGNPPLPRRGSANTFSSAASSSRRPLSASKSASSATILTRKDPLCDNERALGGLRAKAPKLANRLALTRCRPQSRYPRSCPRPQRRSRSPAHPLARPLSRPLARSPARPPARPLVRSFARPLVRSLARVGGTGKGKASRRERPARRLHGTCGHEHREARRRRGERWLGLGLG